MGGIARCHSTWRNKKLTGIYTDSDRIIFMYAFIAKRTFDNTFSFAEIYKYMHI